MLILKAITYKGPNHIEKPKTKFGLEFEVNVFDLNQNMDVNPSMNQLQELSLQTVSHLKHVIHLT